MTREKGYHWDTPYTASSLQPADPTCKRKARAFAPQSKTSLHWDTCLRGAEVSLLRLNAFGSKVCGKGEANKTSNTVLGVYCLHGHIQITVTDYRRIVLQTISAPALSMTRCWRKAYKTQNNSQLDMLATNQQRLGH